MATKGLKYPVFGVYANSAYTDGAVLGNAMTAGATYEYSDAELRADDVVKETDKSFVSGKLTVGVFGMTLATRAKLLGHATTAGGFSGNVADDAPYVGVGYYGAKTGGKFVAIFYPKVQFGEPADEMATKQKTVEYKTPVLEGTIMTDDDNDWIFVEEFSLEADAIAWLNGKVGISSTPSTGLSALVLTGTGGTISPAFGAAVRYYTFGGLTGTNFTVTATAANHVIEMYVNDVFTQKLTSGSASNAVAMAAIGTKKIKLVAYENGKESQTTEIVVVKTV